MPSWIGQQVQKVILPENHPAVAARRAICDACPDTFQLPFLSGLISDQCKHCGCFTRPKTRLAHEKCPIGKW